MCDLGGRELSIGPPSQINISLITQSESEALRASSGHGHLVLYNLNSGAYLNCLSHVAILEHTKNVDSHSRIVNTILVRTRSV